MKQPRLVFVDKNKSKGTVEHFVEVEMSARIFVPGYADPYVLEIRCGLTISAGGSRANWVLMTADAKAVFLVMVRVS